jgi:hypothetical protein
MPCLMVLIHHGLHVHTRGINAFAYGEFHFFLHASTALLDRQYLVCTELGFNPVEAGCPLILRIYPLFLSTMYFLSSFRSCISSQGHSSIGDSFSFLFFDGSKAIASACLLKKQRGQAGGGFQCGTCGSNVDELVCHNSMRGSDHRCCMRSHCLICQTEAYGPNCSLI